MKSSLRLIVACTLPFIAYSWYGGNVVVTLIEGRNLPQLDYFGAASGRTDAFVKVSKLKTATTDATSKVVSNSLNPVWDGPPGAEGEYLYLGMQDSGATISLEAWDYDTGLEFNHDLIGKAKLTVQDCWYDIATWQRISCTKNPEYYKGRWTNADCFNSDSSWAMEYRKVCNATQWVNLKNGNVNDVACKNETGKAPCLLIDVTVVPVAVDVEHKAGGEGFADDLELVIAEDNMYMYLDSTATLDGKYNLFRNFKDNSLYLKGYNSDKDIGDRGGKKYYSDFLSLSINLPSLVYICRWAADNSEGLPGWIQQQGYQGVGSNNDKKKWTLISDAVRPDGYTSSDRYQCYYSDFEPTVRDRYGEVVSDSVKLGSNLPTNAAISTVFNYLILIKGDTSVKKSSSDYTEFTVGTFFLLLLQFLPMFFFLALSGSLLKSTNLRFDRIEDYLLAQPIGGENKTVVGLLFDCPGFKTEDDIKDNESGRPRTVEEKRRLVAKDEQAINLKFAMHLYFSEKSVKISAAIGPCIVWVFGICCCGTVRPAAIGAGVLFISTALGLWWYAVALGQSLNWRLTDAVVGPVAGGICCVLVFVLAVVFFEGRAYEDGRSIDFAALTTVFLTLNLMPNIASTFMNDESYQQQAKQVSAAVSLAATAVTAKRNQEGDEDTHNWIQKVSKAVSAGKPIEEVDKKKSDKAMDRLQSIEDETKRRKKEKKKKQQAEDEKKPLDILYCCKATYEVAYDVYLKVMAWCERERAKFVFLLWLTTGWFGGEFIYLGEYNDAMMRIFGVLMVFATSSLGLSFCVIPVLVAIWINDWRSLPTLLWRYEGKAGSPYSNKLEQRQGQSSGPDALAILLAPCYSISGVLSAFKFSGNTSEDVGSAKRTVRACYALSVALLICYCYAAWWRAPNKTMLALLISLLMLVCDSVHFTLGGKNSSVDWSPGFRISLRTGGRMAVAVAGTRYWLVGFAGCYALYALALVGEILAGVLPNMNNHEAAGIIFFGHDVNKSSGRDISGRPIVALGYLTFLFLLLLTIVAYFQPSGLPITVLETPTFLSGVGEASEGWPSYIFAASAFLAIMAFGFLAAAKRATHLRKHGLLNEYLAQVYFVFRKIKVEHIFGFSGALSLLCLGGFLYAATGSLFCLMVFVFVPPTFVFLGYRDLSLSVNAFYYISYNVLTSPRQISFIENTVSNLSLTFLPFLAPIGVERLANAAWVSTDYQLVVWPPTPAWDKAQAIKWGVVVPPPPGSGGAPAGMIDDNSDDEILSNESDSDSEEEEDNGNGVISWFKSLRPHKIMPLSEENIGGAPSVSIDDEENPGGVIKKLDPSFDMPNFAVSKSRKDTGGKFEMPPLPLKSNVLEKRKKEASLQQSNTANGQASRQIDYGARTAAPSQIPSTSTLTSTKPSSRPGSRGDTPTTPSGNHKAMGYVSTPPTSNNYLGSAGAGGGGGGMGNYFQEDIDLNAVYNNEDMGESHSLARDKGVQQKIVDVRKPRFGVTAFLRAIKAKILSLCERKGDKKKKKKKKKKDKKEKKRLAEKAKQKMGSSHDPAYEQYFAIGPIEAVVDGWLYDHEMVTLVYGVATLLILVFGGLACASSLTREPEVIDEREAASQMIPEGQVNAEQAAVVGVGGLNMGWIGHALWMLSWAAIFLYMAVKKWLSVGGPCTIVGCVETVIDMSQLRLLIPVKVREKWAKKENAKREEMIKNGIEPEEHELVHPLVAVCVLLSIIMVVICCAVLFFGAPVHGNTNDTLSLWLLDVVILYPIFLAAIFELLAWRDDNWHCTKPQDDDRDGNIGMKEHCKACLDKDGDGKLGFLEVFVNLAAKLVYVAGAFFLLITLFIWGDLLVASTVLILVGCIYIGLALLRDWSLNDFYLSAQSEKATLRILKLAMAISLLGGIFTSDPQARIYALSVFFLIVIGTELCLVMVRVSAILSTDPDAPIYFSSYVVPVYIYSSRDNYVADETQTVLHIYVALLAGVGWGVFVSIFNPNGPAFGVALTSIFLLSGCVVTALAVSYTETTLTRNAAKFADSRMFAEAAGAARKAFKQRNQPLEFSSPEYEEQLRLENEKMGFGNLYTAGGYAKEEEDSRCAAEIASNISQIERKFTNKYYSGVEALADALSGEGPMGWVALGGLGKACGKGINLCMASAEELKAYQKKKAKEKKRKSKNVVVPEMDVEAAEDDPFMQEMKAGGGATKEVKMRLDAPNHSKLQSRLQVLPLEDTSLSKMFELEYRCMCHFQLLISVATEAKLKREQVLLQKFLRNYRFSLISNGIGPPETIFSTESYSSVDLRLVALWLSSLTNDERGRFHVLRDRFAKDQALKDAAIEDANRQLEYEANDLEVERQGRELVMCERFQKELMHRRALRLQAWLKSLSGTEAERFLELRTLWEMGQDVPQPSRSDILLRNRYETEVLLKNEEALVNAREMLEELEKGGAPQGVRKGKYASSRARQYFDPIFPPTAASVGYIARAQETDPTLWKSSVEINVESVVFSGGTDPDDVHQGLINDQWLLSAICMLSAAGGVGDGDVDEQIERLFVHRVNPADGTLICESSVGAFGVRLFKNGQWETVIVDDHFPIIPDDTSGATPPISQSDSKGMAVAYSKNMSEIWVSLLEKAFAKYLGSYAELERGFVHHALKDLTGCEAQMMFIAEAARGNGRNSLWESMRRNHESGYILGCGSLPAELTDKSLQESGLVFDATYCIFDVRQINGLKLLQLRNPPGDHGEWKGDWGDSSSLWTRQLKRKLNWSDDDGDNTFWMSFDDFCNVFRCLYVCKYFDRSRWVEHVKHGWWSLTDPKTGEGEDTAMGLPHPEHNPNCELEKNPTYSITIRRPTDLRLVLTQRDASGVSPPQLNPISMFVVSSMGSGTGQRATRVHELTRSNVIADTGPCVSKRTIELDLPSLRPGVYMILCTTFAAGQLGPFELTCFANSNGVNVSQVYPPLWRTAAAKPGVTGVVEVDDAEED